MRIVVHDYAGHPFQFDLSREFARRGHDVAHLYFAEDQGPKGAVERLPEDPLNFVIVPVTIGRPYSKSNLFDRWRNDRAYGAAAARLIRKLKPDLVISGNTPLEAQGAIISATHQRGALFVNWVQDFYSLAIDRLLSRRWLGAGRLLSAYYQAIERRHFAQSDGIVLISDDFRPHAQEALADTAKVSVIPNWGALASLDVRPKDNAWAQRHGLADRFVFFYSGTLGLKHNPSLLIDLADAFSNRPEVAIVVAAAGTGRDRLDEALKRDPRPNLMVLPLQPFEQFADVLGAADVFVALLEQEAGAFSVPSKILSYMCAGRPTLLSGPSENLGSRMLMSSGAGRSSPAGDSKGLIAEAERFYSNGGARLAAGDAARAYAEEHFEIRQVADRFEVLFRRVATNPAPLPYPRAAVMKTATDPSS